MIKKSKGIVFDIDELFERIPDFKKYRAYLELLQVHDELFTYNRIKKYAEPEQQKDIRKYAKLYEKMIADKRIYNDLQR